MRKILPYDITERKIFDDSLNPLELDDEVEEVQPEIEIRVKGLHLIHIKAIVSSIKVLRLHAKIRIIISEPIKMDGLEDVIIEFDKNG